MSDQPPKYYPPPPPPQGQAILVVNANNPHAFSEFPMHITCPHCQNQVVTNVHYVNGALVWIIVIILLLFFFPLMCVPCCIDQLKDVEHFCPHCNNLIGTKRRI